MSILHHHLLCHDSFACLPRLTPCIDILQRVNVVACQQLVYFLVQSVFRRLKSGMLIIRVVKRVKLPIEAEEMISVLQTACLIVLCKNLQTRYVFD